ncbi:UNVERIFIED_CONTAM: hypothetical protein GTU68_049219 [Idotea baltica]|nr:hypothetical protein [Idotea baltica]
MTFGVISILLTGSYLAYMNTQNRKNKNYIAISDDGTETLMSKKSKWD